jgi:WD40 repeat protein
MRKLALLGPTTVFAFSTICHALTPSPVHCLEPSPDSTQIAVNLAGGNAIALFDLGTGKMIHKLETAAPREKPKDVAFMFDIDANGWVRAIRFSPDGRYLAAAVIRRDAEVMVWDLRKQKPTPLLIRGHQWADCDALAFKADGTHLITYMRASPNGRNYLVSWNLESGRETWRVDIGKDNSDAVEFLAGERIRVTRESNRYGVPPRITHHDAKNGEAIEAPAVAKPEASPVPRFTLTSKDTKLQVLDTRTNVSRELQALGTIRADVIVQDKFVIAAVNAGLQVWDAATGKRLYNLGDPTPPKGGSIFTDSPAPSKAGSIFTDPPAPPKGSE